MRRIHHQKIDTGFDQTFGALVTVFTNARCSRGAQTSLSVLGGVRIELRFFNVLDGNETDTTALIVDNEKLFNTMSVQQTFCFVLIDILADRNEVLTSHELVDFLLRIGRKTDVAIGQDTDKTARPLGSIFNDRNTGNSMRLHQCLCIGQGCIRSDRDRIYNHAGLEFLYLPDFFRLTFRRQIAVNDANTTGLRHRNSQTGFRHRIHGSRKKRKVKLDILGDARAQINLPRHYFGMARLQQHIVKCESESASRRFHDFSHCQFLCRFYRMRKAASPE